MQFRSASISGSRTKSSCCFVFQFVLFNGPWRIERRLFNWIFALLKFNSNSKTYLIGWFPRLITYELQSLRSHACITQKENNPYRTIYPRVNNIFGLRMFFLVAIEFIWADSLIFFSHSANERTWNGFLHGVNVFASTAQSTHESIKIDIN